MTTEFSTTGPLDESLSSVFEERAEYLSAVQLNSWSATTPRDGEILTKLRAPGTKLLTGPRGSGKSTLLRRAYFDLLEGDQVLVAYVNYARSLALEPLFHRRSDALVLFRQWVLLKIVQGLRKGFAERGLQCPPGLAELAESATDYVTSLEVKLMRLFPRPRCHRHSLYL